MASAARRFVEGKDWLGFGYARLEDHSRERFGRCGRWVRDLKTLAEVAERSPALSDAVSGADGGDPIGSVSALAIGKIATPESSHEWVALARRVSVRKLRDEIRRAAEAGVAWPLDDDGQQTGEGDWRGRLGKGTGSEQAGGGSGSAAPGKELTGNARAAGVRERQACVAKEGDAHDASTAPVDSLSSLADEIVTADERRLIRFGVPSPVRAAVEEAHDLHRAICGGETSTEEFVEAIVADSFAGPIDIPVDDERPRERSPLATRERSLEEESHGWMVLQDPRFPQAELAGAAATLREAARLCRQSEVGTRDPDRSYPFPDPCRGRDRRAPWRAAGADG